MMKSLILVEERIFEANYFARRLSRAKNGDSFGYELNAFLSAARSVTFLLQKEMASVPGFGAWYEDQRRLLKGDPAASFFLNLRNFSQKEGKVPLIGCQIVGRRWTYRFAGRAEPVPQILLHRDVSDCCREHVAKLARLILDFSQVFPYYSCYRIALTPNGIAELSLSIEEIEESLGLPKGWISSCATIDFERALDELRRHFDGVDFESLRKLADWAPKAVASECTLSEHLLASLVTHSNDLINQASRRPGRAKGCGSEEQTHGSDDCTEC